MSHPADVIHERVIALLRPFLRLLPPDQPLPLDADLGFLGLDSLQTIDLLMALEQEFDIRIPDELIAAETFATAGNVTDLVRSSLA